MRPYLPGGLINVRKSINNDFPNLWLTADLYSFIELENLEEQQFGQTWTIRFNQRHQCHGAMLMQIHATTAHRRWTGDLDDSLTYAVTPYMDTDDGGGGFYYQSFGMTDADLELLLKVTDDRLGLLELKCDAARTLFRQSLYQHLNRDDAAIINTTEVSSYYHDSPQELYS